jgi:hypothetical protein
MKDKQLTLRQTLDSLAAEGKEIKVTWEGGNDSGGLDLFIDGNKVDYYSPVYDEIVDPIADHIDYGSWAGDYFADGTVYYNSDEGAFIGEGKETSSDGSSISNISIEIRVPKILNFDRVEINTEGTHCWDELNTTFKFVVVNGPVFQEHLEIESAMESHVRESVVHILETHEECKDEEIGWVYNDWSIRRELFIEDGEDLVYVMDELDFSINYTKYNSHHIPINEEQ